MIEQMSNMSIRFKKKTIQKIKELAEKNEKRPTEQVRVIVENFLNSMQM